MTKSLTETAIDGAGDLAWILRTALDANHSGADLVHVMRNVTCAGMRKAIACVPADADLKVPTNRTAVIELLASVIRHLRAYGYVETSSVFA